MISRKFESLTALCTSGRFRATAHRGASYEYPENTITAMEHAVETGADIIEFDLRASADGVPVVLHDTTVDRTSNGSGTPESRTLAELKKLDFGFFRHFERLESSCAPGERIPTFEEILARFRDRAGMNIQLYAAPAVLPEVCRLYRTYDMYDRGYLTIADREVADAIRKLDPEIEICLTPGWHERALPENLEKCAAYGCRFVQPTIESFNAETAERCAELGLFPNIFFADEPEKFTDLEQLGASGVMTNRIERLDAWRTGRKAVRR